MKIVRNGLYFMELRVGRPEVAASGPDLPGYDIDAVADPHVVNNTA
jgi:hypothetical protein